MNTPRRTLETSGRLMQGMGDSNGVPEAAGPPDAASGTPESAAYVRPGWMTDEQWQQTSADMTDYWLTLLDRAARASVLPRH